MLAARRSAREALTDMAQQNARLVSAYVEKKQELRGVAEAAREERAAWQVCCGHVQRCSSHGWWAEGLCPPPWSLTPVHCLLATGLYTCGGKYMLLHHLARSARLLLLRLH